ncbi:MAG: chorismate synthase, partial [Eubacterium sp.]|nr:chorismate synthase [Eubacterium sp.]
MAAGSSFGTLYRISSWGETHGEAVGVVVDGCPAGLNLCEDDIQTYLDRRRPGQSVYSSPRKEKDRVRILSGLFEGQTTGTPISIMVYNEEKRSEDYDAFRDLYRPGHADYTYEAKYGIRDYRGGGRSSGRETIARVAAGAVAAKVLKQMGIELFAYTRSVGPVSITEENFSPSERDKNSLYMPDAEAAGQAREYLEQLMEKKDSAGGVVECHIKGLPAGLGDPVFDKLHALLGQAVLSIGAVKGFEIGDGFQAAASRGSLHNDSFYMEEGKI